MEDGGSDDREVPRNQKPLRRGSQATPAVGGGGRLQLVVVGVQGWDVGLKTLPCPDALD